MTRLFVPEDFGIFAIFTSIFNIIISFATFRFELSVPNTSSTKESAALIVFGTITLAFCSVFSYLILFCFIHIQLDGILDKIKVIAPYLWLMPFAIFGGGLSELFDSWHIKQANLFPVSRATIYQSLSKNLLSLLCGFANFGPTGLIASFAISFWIRFTRLAKYAENLLSEFRNLSKDYLKEIFKMFRFEAGGSTFASVINALANNVPIFILTFLFTTIDIGKYAVTYRLAVAPLGFFVSALSQSYWAAAAELSRKKEYSKLYKLYKKTIFRLMLPCLFIIIFCASGPLLAKIISIVLGTDKWADVGYILFAMTPMLIGLILFSTTTHLIVFGRQHLHAFADIFQLLLMLGVAVFARYTNLSFIKTVFWLSCASLFGYISLFMLHLREYKKINTLKEIQFQ